MMSELSGKEYLEQMKKLRGIITRGEEAERLKIRIGGVLKKEISSHVNVFEAMGIEISERVIRDFVWNALEEALEKLASE